MIIQLGESFFLLIGSGSVGVFVDSLEMGKSIVRSPGEEVLTLVQTFVFSLAFIITEAFLFVIDCLVES